MRIAFYAPMKPPDHPTPSGDRRMARLLISALEQAGHETLLASRLRSWCRSTEIEEKWPSLVSDATAEIDRLQDLWVSAEKRPDVWFTYHLYHKAPDLIGPKVAAKLGIPYVAAEASRAAKQADGPWSKGFGVCDQALRQADKVFALTQADRPGLAAVVPERRLIDLPPFLDISPWAAASEASACHRRRWYSGPGPHLLAVGMMREGDKDASYRVLADAMEKLADKKWHLTIAGEGPMRAQVLERFPPGRVTAIGLMPPEDLATLYAGADLFVWPAINEAYGLALLEAQATGSPAVAGRTGGVPDIVEDGVTGLLPAVGDAGAFAEAIRSLTTDPRRMQAMGAAARRKIADRHSLENASTILDRHLREIVG